MRYFTVQVYHSMASYAYYYVTQEIFLSEFAAQTAIDHVKFVPDDVQRNSRVDGANQEYIDQWYPGQNVHPSTHYLPYQKTKLVISEHDELWAQERLWDYGIQDRVNPWGSERWYTRQYTEVHGLHASEADPKSCTYWDGRRWVSMKPGKYLKKFCDFLTPRQIEFQSKIWTDGRGDAADRWPKVVKFATTAQEVKFVYDNGPQSCMKGMPGVIAYADSDLAVAYLYDEDEEWVIARAVCWPDKKVFGRIYPNDSDFSYQDDGFATMEELREARDYFKKLLRDDGWTSYEESGPEVFEGARMPMLGVVNRPHRYYMPYPDHLSSYIDEETGQFVMASEAPKGATLVSGTTESIVTLRPAIDYFNGKTFYSHRPDPNVIAPDGSKVDVIDLHDDSRIFHDPHEYEYYIRHKGMKFVKVISGGIYDEWRFDRIANNPQYAVTYQKNTLPNDYYWTDHKGRNFQTKYEQPVTFGGKKYHPYDPELTQARSDAQNPNVKAKKKAQANLKAAVKAKKQAAPIVYGTFPLTAARLYATGR